MEESCWVFIWDSWESWVRSQEWGGCFGRQGDQCWDSQHKLLSSLANCCVWNLPVNHNGTFFFTAVMLLLLLLLRAKWGMYFKHQCGPHLTITCIKMTEKDREISCFRWEKFSSPTSVRWQKVEQHNSVGVGLTRVLCESIRMRSVSWECTQNVLFPLAVLAKTLT